MKKPKELEYVIVRNGTNEELIYFSINVSSDKVQTLWNKKENSGYRFKNLKLANVIMNVLGGCYIKEV